MKMDRKLLSKQEHEIAYVRKLARDFDYCLKKYGKMTEDLDDAMRRSSYIISVPGPKSGGRTTISIVEAKRICKAVLKFARVKRT